MATLNLGGMIRLTYAVKNDLQVAVNPVSATLTIIQPDGTTAAGTTISLPPTTTGLLVYDFTPTQAGLHSVHWSTTGPVTAEDDVFVAERPASLLISVDEAVSHLRATGVITSDADREQLQWLVALATEAIEADLGRIIVRRSVTDTYDGGTGVIVLRSTPVISVQSVTVGGVALLASGYTLNTATGLLYCGSTGWGYPFTYGFQNVVVAYTAGYAIPPRPARMVALTLVQALWQASQQAFHPALDESAELVAQSALAGLPDPLRRAYDSLRLAAVA